MHHNDFINKCQILWVYMPKNVQFFHKIVVRQISNMQILTFSFIHTGLTEGHKPGPVNLGVLRCSNSMSVLAHCRARRCQRHSNGTSGRSISCTSIQLNIMVVCNSKNLSFVRFHCHVSKSFKQLC